MIAFPAPSRPLSDAPVNYSRPPLLADGLLPERHWPIDGARGIPSCCRTVMAMIGPCRRRDDADAARGRSSNQPDGDRVPSTRKLNASCELTTSESGRERGVGRVRGDIIKAGTETVVATISEGRNLASAEDDVGSGTEMGPKAGEGKMKAVPPGRHRTGVCTSFSVEAGRRPNRTLAST